MIEVDGSSYMGVQMLPCRGYSDAFVHACRMGSTAQRTEMHLGSGVTATASASLQCLPRQGTLACGGPHS